MKNSSCGFLIGVVLLFASLPASAQILNACPNVVVGILNGADPAIYSDCTMENASGTPGFHLTMSVDGGFVQVRADGWLAGNLNPAPTGDVQFGRFNGSDLVAEDMGPNYSGQCLDMSTPNPTLAVLVPAVDGNVYCYRVSNTDGNQVYIRGRLDVPGATWLNPIVVNTQPGVGAPVAPAQPVPTLPYSLLGLLMLLLAGIGARSSMRRSRKVPDS